MKCCNINMPPIIENTKERVDSWEVKRWGGMPKRVEDRGVTKLWCSDEEETIGAYEGSVGLVLVLVLSGCRESREEEPSVGSGVKGKGLVVL